MSRQRFLAIVGTVGIIASIQLSNVGYAFAAGQNQQLANSSPVNPASQRSEAVDSKHLIDPELLKLFKNAPPGGDINAKNLAVMNQGFIAQEDGVRSQCRGCFGRL
jgi:hypothetical protein